MTRDECLACLVHLQRRQFRCEGAQTHPLEFGKPVQASASDPWHIYVWDKDSNRIKVNEPGRIYEIKRGQCFDWKEW